jgi:UDP-N-acetylmuramoyl-tripeptide--D-alanyl-D-alanine ligase
MIYDIESLYAVFLESPHVVIDSRTVRPGSLFFAIRGERFDGNLFAASALSSGATYAVVDNPDVVAGNRYILVPDALTALQDLARHHRIQHHVPVVGITGSNGKTTTKELVLSVLTQSYYTLCTQGNLNNHIGVPLTLLRLRHDHKIAVIEMGANHQGEIALLCDIARPTHGVITNMGKAHLEGFGGVEGVQKGKSELYDWLARMGGLGFINTDEPHLLNWAQKRGLKRIIQYQSSVDLDRTHEPIEATLIRAEPFVQVDFLSESGEHTTLTSQLTGAYNYPNILTAIALGKYFKVPASDIKSAIESYLPQNNRSQMSNFRNTPVILDAYNANPDSMAAALHNLARLPGYKIALLGHMLELGSASPYEHTAIIRLAQELKIDVVAVVGAEFEKAQRPAHVPCFENTAALKVWLNKQTWPAQTTILVKGSRGIQMETVLD